MRIAKSALLVLLVAGAGVWLMGGRPHPLQLFGNGDQPNYLADGRYIGSDRADGNGLNLVVIVLDTVRADCVGDGGEAPGNMPFLSKLAQEGMRCTRVTAPAPFTNPSITSLLTGLLPDEHGVDHTPDPPRLPAGITTFAEALSRGHKYETAAFMQIRLSNEPNAPMQGFDTVHAAAPLHAWRGAIGKWNQTRRRRRPFFLLLHTFEAHDPYGEENHPWPEDFPTNEEYERTPRLGDVSDPVLVETFMRDRGVRIAWLQDDTRGVFDRVFQYFGRGYAAAPDPALAARLEAAYRRGVGWVDRQLQDAVAHLREQGLLENTLLVVTSDHGEAFGEHGVLSHGRSLHRELVHVPLVAVGPAPFSAGRVASTSIGLIDLMPTFFELAGLPPLDDTTGRSMLGALTADGAGRAVLSIEDISAHKMGKATNVKLVSARTATESYILSYDVHAGVILESLYDTAADPKELHDLAAATGRVGAIPVSAALAAAIERARDRIWTSISASQNHLQGGYGAGVATVTTGRPPSPSVR